MRSALLAGLLIACSPKAKPAAPPAAPPAEEGAMIENIEETTVGDLDGTRVPMGSMTTDAYTLPDGTEKTGLVCALVLPDGAVWVGLGSQVEVDGATWEVVGIEKERGENGSVTLKRME